MDKRKLEQELLHERHKRDETSDWLEDEKQQHKQTADKYAASQERHKHEEDKRREDPPTGTQPREQAYSPTRASAQNMRQFIGSNSPRGRTANTSREGEERMAAIVAAHEDEADSGYQRMDVGSQGKRYLHELKEVKIRKVPHSLRTGRLEVRSDHQRQHDLSADRQRDSVLG